MNSEVDMMTNLMDHLQKFRSGTALDVPGNNFWKRIKSCETKRSSKLNQKHPLDSSEKIVKYVKEIVTLVPTHRADTESD